MRRILICAAATVLLAACSSQHEPQSAPRSSAAASAPAPAPARATTPAPSSTAHAAVRTVVEHFGKQMQDISTLAPPDAIRAELPQVYAGLLAPDLLADWKAHPDRVVGRNYGSSPWPTRIEIASVHCATPDTCQVTGKVDYITSNEVEHGGVFMRRGIALDVARTGSGWRITAARLAPDRTR